MSYTRQLIEPIRIEIGKMLIAHEIMKLFPKLGDYDQIKIQVNERWTNLSDSDVVIVRDFWNLVDSLMMGYKLKEIVRDITSQRYTWSLSDQSISSIRFSSNINGLACNTKTASEINALLEKNPAERKRIIDGTNASFLDTDKRYLDPIILLSQGNDLFVHDGNGRLLRAILEGSVTIKAYIGVNTPSEKHNYWVPTSYLMMLADARLETALVGLIRESENALFEFNERVVASDDFKQNVLRQAGL